MEGHSFHSLAVSSFLFLVLSSYRSNVEVTKYLPYSSLLLRWHILPLWHVLLCFLFPFKLLFSYSFPITTSVPPYSLLLSFKRAHFFLAILRCPSFFLPFDTSLSPYLPLIPVSVSRYSLLFSSQTVQFSLFVGAPDLSFSEPSRFLTSFHPFQRP